MRAAVILLIALLAAPAGATAGTREPLDIRLFARVPNPGQPEPVAIGPDGLVYVGTNQLAHGDPDAPSKVFAFDQSGQLVREYVVEGQKLDEDHGIQGLAFDGRGLLYALDRAARPRVIVIDPESGRQWDYAVFRDVPRCQAAGRTTDCSATMVLDAAAEPDYAAFAPDGALYVTDIEQALIWRVPPGGGDPEVWYTDARFENIFGPNGIYVLDGGRTLLYAVTALSPGAGNPTEGALFRQPVNPDGSPGEPEELWRSRPLDAPDGFAVGRSGRVYLALAGASQVVLLSPEGQELARAPSDPAANAALEVPVDSPGSMAFLGDRVLMSNHSAIRGDPNSWAILDVYAGERGLPLFRPLEPPAAALPGVDSWAFAIGSGQLRRGAVRRLSRFDLVVVDGQEARPRLVRRLRARGTIVLAYLSVGTIEPGRPWYRRAKRFRLRDRFEEFGEWYAATSKPGYRRLIARRAAPRMLRRGFDGLFLDNTDMIEAHPRQARGMHRLARTLGRLVHRRDGLLFTQNGASTIGPSLRAYDGWNREDVTRTYDFGRGRYVPVPRRERRAARRELRRMAAKGLLVTASDYVPRGARRATRAAVRSACRAGALPFVTDIGIRRLPKRPYRCG